jgi:cytochrome c-type biogenesis protein CcmE
VADDVKTGVSETTSGRRRWKTVLAIVVGVLAIAWLALFLTIGGSFYKTVDELKSATLGQPLRVGGMVSEGSIQQTGDTVVFTIESTSGSKLPVSYTGAYPSRLGPFEQVVVAGSLTPSGTLEATEVLVKCPNKLFPEQVANGVLSGLGLQKLLY